MLQPLSLAAPPVSAFLLFKDGVPVEPAWAAAHPLTVRQALRYLPGHMLPTTKLPCFHRYLTSLGSRSWTAINLKHPHQRMAEGLSLRSRQMG